MNLPYLKLPFPLLCAVCLGLGRVLSPAATVLVSDATAGDVIAYDVTGSTWISAGTFIASGSYGGVTLDATHGPAGLASDGTNVYLATSGGVLRFDTSGNFMGVVTTTTNADGLTIDGSGNLYFSTAFGSNANALYKVTNPSGTPSVSTLVNTGLSTPRGVAIGGNGDLFVANRGTGTIAEYTTSGTLVGTLASGLTNPQALSWDAANNRLLLSYGSSTLQNIGGLALDGTLTPLFQNPGGAGFTFTVGIANVNGTVYGTNYNNKDINSVTGLTTFGTAASGSDALGYMLVLAPEPGTWGLLGLGLGCGLLWIRRRRHAAC